MPARPPSLQRALVLVMSGRVLSQFKTAMALLSRLLVVLVAALSLVSALPGAEDKNHPKCRNKLQRKAWLVILRGSGLGRHCLHGHRHTLSKKEKKAYIDAELCLMKKPAKLGLPGATVRFEELQANHQIQAAITHNVVSGVALAVLLYT